jgi:hypothetical protein
VVHGEEGDREPEEAAWGVRLYPVLLKREETEEGGAVRESLVCGIDGGWLLDPVKFPEARVMIIVSMGPDDGIDMGRTRAEELLAEVGRGVDQEVFPLCFDEKGCAKALDPVFLCEGAILAGTPDLGGPHRVPCAEEVEVHVNRAGHP